MRPPQTCSPLKAVNPIYLLSIYIHIIYIYIHTHRSRYIEPFLAQTPLKDPKARGKALMPTDPKIGPRRDSLNTCRYAYIGLKKRSRRGGLSKASCKGSRMAQERLLRRGIGTQFFFLKCMFLHQDAMQRARMPRSGCFLDSEFQRRPRCLKFQGPKPIMLKPRTPSTKKPRHLKLLISAETFGFCGAQAPAVCEP